MKRPGKAPRRRKAARTRTSRPSRRATSPALSLRAFARRLGVDAKAVRKGVASGRLKASVGLVHGRPTIADPELAAREWVEGATKPAPNGAGSGTLTAAQIRVAEQRSEALRLSNEQRSGRLILASEARREQFACARTVRDSLLNIPARLAGELAAESDEARVYARLDEELRAALTTIAEVLAHAD